MYNLNSATGANVNKEKIQLNTVNVRLCVTRELKPNYATEVHLQVNDEWLHCRIATKWIRPQRTNDVFKLTTYHRTTTVTSFNQTQ